MTKIDELIRTAQHAMERIEGVRLTILGRGDGPELAFRLDEIETELRTAWTDAEAELGRIDDVEPSETGAVVAGVLGTEVDKLLDGEAIAFKAGNGLTVSIMRDDAART